MLTAKIYDFIEKNLAHNYSFKHIDFMSEYLWIYPSKTEGEHISKSYLFYFYWMNSNCGTYPEKTKTVNNLISVFWNQNNCYFNSKRHKQIQNLYTFEIIQVSRVFRLPNWKDNTKIRSKYSRGIKWRFVSSEQFVL